MKKILIILPIILIIFGCGSSSQDSNQDSKSNDVTESYCYLKKISEKDKKQYIDVDYIEFLTGEESAEEAKKANIPDLGYFIVNDDTQLQTFSIADAIEITLLDIMSGEPIKGKSINELMERDLSSLIAKITVSDGKITKIEQVFVP